MRPLRLWCSTPLSLEIENSDASVLFTLKAIRSWPSVTQPLAASESEMRHTLYLSRYAFHTSSENKAMLSIRGAQVSAADVDVANESDEPTRPSYSCVSKNIRVDGAHVFSRGRKSSKCEVLLCLLFGFSLRPTNVGTFTHQTLCPCRTAPLSQNPRIHDGR